MHITIKQVMSTGYLEDIIDEILYKQHQTPAKHQAGWS